MQTNNSNPQWHYFESAMTRQLDWASIQRRTGLQIHRLCDFDRLAVKLQSILILDYHWRSHLAGWSLGRQVDLNEISVVLTNVPPKVDIDQLFGCGRVRGVFPPATSIEEYAQGFCQIHDGGHWISHQLGGQLLDYIDSVFVRLTPPHHLRLTPREVDVLRRLQQGHSNTKLADNLFLSEHTVKSHLTRIFRKLEVKNRQQACEWAHYFLPPVPKSPQN